MNIHQNIELNATETAFSTAYGEARDGLPGVADGTLAAVRDEAMARFKGLGLPHRRIEEWHYTDLRRLLDKPDVLARVSENGMTAELPRPLAGNAARLVFVNGRFVAERSDIAGLGDGVEIRPLSDGQVPEWAIAELKQRQPQGDNAMFDLCSALWTDGAMIIVRAGQSPARPIEIINQSDGDFNFLRHVVCLEDGASLRLAECAGGGAGLSVAAMSVVQGDKSKLSHVKVQDISASATHIAPMVAEVGAEARIDSFTLTLGAGLAREERHVRFGGDDGRGSVSGAFLLSGKTHADMTLNIDHAMPGGESSEVFRGIVDDRAKSVVQTNVIVAQYAQKTDARQAVHVLLLSDEAEHNTKPELEIYADDVQCAHGATIGQLDETSLFYLMSRGISKKRSEAMLVEAFISEAIDEIGDLEFRESLAALATERLSLRLDEGTSHG